MSTLNPIGTDRAVRHDVRTSLTAGSCQAARYQSCSLKLRFVLKQAESAFYMQPKGIPRYLRNTFSILSRQTLDFSMSKISLIFNMEKSKVFKMAKKMAVQEVLDEIVQIRILDIRILTMNYVIFLSLILLL